MPVFRLGDPEEKRRPSSDILSFARQMAYAILGVLLLVALVVELAPLLR
jgi:hypothetical protein